MAADTAGQASGVNDFASGGGMAASHVLPVKAAVYVAPSTAPAQRNAIRFNLVTVACWRLNHVLFAFDSSVVVPEVADEVTRLAALVRAHPGAPAAVFGHADPVGKDDYNKTLSGRRALAIYGLLVRDTSLWETLYKTPMAGDNWGLQSIQLMLGRLEQSPAVPFFGGTPSGTASTASTQAIKDFQAANGLAADGDAGPLTRQALFGAYMDLLCAASGEPFVMTPDQFLGGGADAGLKAACQGCGEFNPVVLVSRADTERFANAQGALKAERDERNAPNRRVMLFLFRPGTQVDPGDWPCPRADEGPAGCKTIFWPDGDQRRQAGDAERHYSVDRHTFACRFYDRFARVSPCEGIVRPILRIHLFDRAGRPIPKAPFTVSGPGFSIDDVATPDGVAVVRNVPVPTTVHVTWSRPAGNGRPAQGPFDLDVFVEFDEAQGIESARRRLSNLGYDVDVDTTLASAVRQFQRDLGVAETGKLDDVQVELQARHDRADPPANRPVEALPTTPSDGGEPAA